MVVQVNRHQFKTPRQIIKPLGAMVVVYAQPAHGTLGSMLDQELQREVAGLSPDRLGGGFLDLPYEIDHRGRRGGAHLVWRNTATKCGQRAHEGHDIGCLRLVANLRAHLISHHLKDACPSLATVSIVAVAEAEE